MLRRLTMSFYNNDNSNYEPAPSEPPPSYDSVDKQPAPVAGGAPAPPRPGQSRAPLPLELAALTALRGKRVILASGSPRRRQLLAQIGITNLEIIPSSFPEDLPKSLAPFEYVLETATRKAMTVYEKEIDNKEKGEPALIIAADTVVVGHYGEILEKPRSEREHIDMLKSLRDAGEHKVFTAVACMRPLESAMDPGYAMKTHVEDTTVKFDKAVTDELILAYVKTREGADKAGGYGIQGIGSILVDRIEGTFDNVVGLPLRATLRLIEEVTKSEEELEAEMHDADVNIM
ncbi:Septum formation protein maf [Neofusicoccum parvum]|uniref:Septum formation protein maf n=2 Tax=Neofusicoccum parvum TaxID=310453 RepID=A0ACB5S4K1_9PEZI|nr:putative septum formation protein maf protein [Neofusicoccum parvum UCRNP2]GME27596.1 Septum formation protein maf [Neofusicoccum parvum]GME36233.1 Septum formation protein maf [Neofusicoccum parvum]